MKEVTVIIEKGNKGDDDMAIDPRGIKIGLTPINVMKDFDEDEIIGTAVPFLEDGVLKAKFKLDKGKFDDLYPAIGYIPIYKPLKNGRHHMTGVELLTVSLCNKPNMDPTIKSIGEQIGN